MCDKAAKAVVGLFVWQWFCLEVISWGEVVYKVKGVLENTLASSVKHSLVTAFWSRNYALQIFLLLLSLREV